MEEVTSVIPIGESEGSSRERLRATGETTEANGLLVQECNITQVILVSSAGPVQRLRNISPEVGPASDRD